MTIKSIAKIIKKAQNIAIIGHVSPDLDCLGSAFSLKESLLSLGKIAVVFTDGPIEEKLKPIFYPNDVESKIFNYKDYDLILIVDTPNPKRLGKLGKEVIKHKNVVRIDHHFDPDNVLTKKFYLDENSSSCAEIAYLLIKELEIEITSKIATFVYAGIVGDTNSFINSNTTANSLLVASKMAEKGADVYKINECFFKSSDIKEWNLSKFVYDKAEFRNNYAIVGVKQKELKKLGVTGEGMSSYANQLLSLKEIILGCTFTERNKNTFYTSFRSAQHVPANKIAEMLGGGGHKCAAACIISGSFKDVREKIIKAIEKVFEEEGLNG